MIARVNVALNGLLLFAVTDISTTCTVVIFIVKMSCIQSVDGVNSGYWPYWSIKWRC